MKTISLTKEHIKYLKTINDINEKKTIIQDYFTKECIKSKFGAIIAGTGIGKTYLGVKLIKKYRRNYQDKVIVIVPTEPLQLNWQSQLTGIPNIEVYIVNTAAKLNLSCGLLIVDEFHTCSSEDQTSFNKVYDIERIFTLLLSATVEEKHLNFAESKGLNLICKLTETQAKDLELTPKSIIYQVPLEFTAKEKFEYSSIQDQVESIGKNLSFLNQGNRIFVSLLQMLEPKYQSNISDWAMKYLNTQAILEKHKKKEIVASDLNNEDIFKDYSNFSKKARSYIYTYASLMRKRNSMFNNAQNKTIALKKLLDQLGQSFIFFNSIKSLEEHKHLNILPYHSKCTEEQKQKNMLKFLSDSKYHLGSVKSLGLGFDLATECKNLNLPFKDIETVINFGFNSSKIDAQQKSGRNSRINLENLEKVAKTYNLYIEDYKIQDNIYESQEKKWLQKATSGFNNKQILDLSDL